MATKVTYTPTTWADGTEGGTPIDAAKLNNIEQGVSDTATLANANMDDIATLKDSISLTVRRLSSQNRCLVTTSGAFTFSDGICEVSLSEYLKSIGFAIAQIASSATSYVIAGTAISGSVVRIQARRLSDNANANTTISVRILALGENA